MPTVLVLSFSDLAQDPRVSRQIGWLTSEFAVTAAGLAAPSRPDVRFIPFAPAQHGKTAKAVRGLNLLLRRHERVYWDTFGPAFAAIQVERPDLIVANDLDTLPMAIRLGDQVTCPVVFDAHEYAPREFDDSWKWRLLRGPYSTDLCRRYIPRAAAITTVGEAIADAYADLTGFRPVVITNATDFHPELSPRPLEPGRVRLVHHGVAVPSRKIENMIRLVSLLDRRFDLSFLLVDGVPAYREELQRLAAGDPRVRFLPPVPMPELPARLNEFDLGLFLLEPTNFNYRHALPNKFFEFLQGRLGIAIGPTPEMARIVRATGTGVVAKDFHPESLAQELNRLTADDVNRFKQAAHAAAREFSADANRAKWLAVCAKARRR